MAEYCSAVYIRLAAKGGWRKDVIGIADWLAQEIDILGVDVQFNTYADDELIAAKNPDVVLIATGGIPNQPLEEELPSVRDVLGGQVRASGEVMIYDGVGEHAALSLADMLAQDGHQVSIDTPDRHLGRGIGGQNMPVYMRNLTRANAQMMTDYKLVKVSRAGNKRIAHLRNAYTREVTEVEADMIVSDFSAEPVTDVFDDLRALSSNLGEIDHEALVALRPQPMDANPEAMSSNRVGKQKSYREPVGQMIRVSKIWRESCDQNADQWRPGCRTATTAGRAA